VVATDAPILSTAYTSVSPSTHRELQGLVDVVERELHDAIAEERYPGRGRVADREGARAELAPRPSLRVVPALAADQR